MVSIQGEWKSGGYLSGLMQYVSMCVSVLFFEESNFFALDMDMDKEDVEERRMWRRGLGSNSTR